MQDWKVLVAVPPKFWEDHQARDLVRGTANVLLETDRLVTLELDREAYDELLSDAEYYASPDGPRDFGGAAGLVSSARATVKRLKAVERPVPSLSSRVGEHELVLLEGEAIEHPAKTDRYIHGPRTVEYRVWDDGGIDMRI